MTTPDEDPTKERLDEVQKEIDEARRQAEEHGTIPDSTPEPTFIDPDADGRIDEDDEEPGGALAP